MQYFSTCWSTIALGVVYGLLVSPLPAQSPADVAPATPVSEDVPEDVSGSIGSPDFPRVVDFGIVGPPITMDSPVRGESLGWIFPICKLSAIVGGIFIWLGGLQLCIASIPTGDAQYEKLTRKLIVIGFVGITIALLLPAYVLGACVLAVTSALPYWAYSQSRKKIQRTRDEANSLVGKKYFSQPHIDLNPVEVSTEMALPANFAVGDASSTIHLLTKAPLSVKSNSGFARGEQSSPAFQHVLALIDHAVRSRATDLHINAKGGLVQLRQRIDGSLISLGELPKELGHSVINVFKVMSDLNIADRRRSQDGSFLADINGRRLSFRVSSQGTQTGEKLSIRILDPAMTFSDLSSLGMTDNCQLRFGEQLSRTHGLILIVGSTGAGKSTTACAALQTLDTGSRNIVSIEDPIEYQIPSVDQIEVNVRAGQTFESVLRSVLRLDADVIFIGEIRDGETARIACQAAQAGQLVMATMHANSSVAGAVRLAEWGYDTHSVADSLRAVLSQTLIRKLCNDCRVPYTPDAEELRRLGMPEFDGPFYRCSEAAEAACANCDGRGFLRRTGVYELTEVNAVISNLIRERKGPPSIQQAAQENGMIPLREEGLRLIREGMISVEEFYRVLGTI